MGNGASAEVFSIEHVEGLCVKTVVNPEKQAENNTIHQEGNYLTKLSNFNIDGVRTPRLYYTYAYLGNMYLVMEELEAVNFRRVLEGNDDLPENFNLESYFDKLKNYMEKMHEKGIYHQDFVLRNWMIDKKTADPYVIDFGKAESRDDIMGERFHVLEKIKIEKDKAGLEAGIAEAKKYFEELINKSNKNKE